jgi:hypothetical protein
MFGVQFNPSPINTNSVNRHATSLIEAASVTQAPFPHLVVDEVFPNAYYALLLRHLPSLSSLNISNRFGMMKLDPSDASLRSQPRDTQRFWMRFDHEVKPVICRALLRRFFPLLDEKLRLIFDDAANRCGTKNLRLDEFRVLRGIVQCRTTGDRMGAHFDKATSLFTYIFYFALDDSLRPYGTILYDVNEKDRLYAAYRATRNIRAWFPAPDEFGITPSKQLEFLPNRLVAFANLPHSLHGTATDAATPRYSMQSFCEMPPRLALTLFAGWNDSVSETGIYKGDV